jgi:hypothetical protein
MLKVLGLQPIRRWTLLLSLLPVLGLLPIRRWTLLLSLLPVLGLLPIRRWTLLLSRLQVLGLQPIRRWTPLLRILPMLKERRRSKPLQRLQQTLPLMLQRTVELELRFPNLLRIALQGLLPVPPWLELQLRF